MPIVPVRNIGKQGIVKDIPAFDLPIGAFSDGNNVRFEDGRVYRAPIFRTADSTITPVNIIGFFVYKNPDGTDHLFYVSNDGSIFEWVGGTEDDVTPAGYATAVNEHPVTFCQLAGVVYNNRYSHVPYKFYPPTGTDFAVLTNWDANHKCRSLRTFRDFLVALNVTKSGVQNPILVKWSDVNVNYASEPPSWDHTSPTTSAGENPLSDADSQIIDGLALRHAFVIYTETQAWLMEHVGGRFVMQFRKLFDDAGILEANCVVEVEGKHFVFGRNDIYAHDMGTKTSIADEWVRRYVYSILNTGKAQHCFASHDPRRHEVIFGFNSLESNIKWPNAEYCNRAAVYNYRESVWSFRDLPNVVRGDVAKVNQTLAWSDANFTWDSFGSTWASQADGGERHLTFPSSAIADYVTEVDLDLIVLTDGSYVVMPSSQISTSRLLILDNATFQAMVSYPVESELETDWFVERRGMDLDELGANIRGYKVCTAIYPQMEIYDNSEVTIEMAGEVTSGVPLDTYDESMTFEPTNEYKVDFRQGGRYLALKFSGTGSHDFALTGLDFKFNALSNR